MAIRASHNNRGKGRNNSGEGEGVFSSRARDERRRAVVVAAAVGTTNAGAGETTLNSLITEVIFREIVLLDSRVTMRTPLIMIILTGLVQSTARYPYHWHLLHLAMGPILKIFCLGPLFLLSISMFLPLTSVLSRDGTVPRPMRLH